MEEILHYVCINPVIHHEYILYWTSNLNSVASRISSNHHQLITFLQNTQTKRFHTEHRRYLFTHLDASRCWHARLGGSAPKPFQQLRPGVLELPEMFLMGRFFSGRQREWKRSRLFQGWVVVDAGFFFWLLLKVFVFFWFCFFFETWICQIFMFGVQMELINVSMKIGFYWWVDVNEGVSLDVAWWNCWKMKMENWCFLRPIV